MRLRVHATVVLATAGIALLGGSAVMAATSSTASTSVRPGTGRPATTFAVHVRVPFSTGLSGPNSRTDTVSVNGPRRSGCVSSATATLPATSAGDWAVVRLGPRENGGRWCRGRFHGVVVQTVSVSCGPSPVQVCLMVMTRRMVMIRPQTIASFHFRVR